MTACRTDTRTGTLADEMTLATDDLEPGGLAAAISDLLIRHGYPPDQVSGWWNSWAYDWGDALRPKPGMITTT